MMTKGKCAILLIWTILSNMAISAFGLFVFLLGRAGLDHAVYPGNEGLPEVYIIIGSFFVLGGGVRLLLCLREVFARHRAGYVNIASYMEDYSPM